MILKAGCAKLRKFAEEKYISALAWPSREHCIPSGSLA